MQSHVVFNDCKIGVGVNQMKIEIHHSYTIRSRVLFGNIFLIFPHYDFERQLEPLMAYVQELERILDPSRIFETGSLKSMSF